MPAHFSVVKTCHSIPLNRLATKCCEKSGLGISRSEYEYEIPIKDAKELLADLCFRPLIEKRRFKIKSENHVWEIDEFYGENAGLVVAEIELASEEEQFAKPKWLGKEVSDDKRYYNICLVDHPFCDWTDKQDEL